MTEFTSLVAPEGETAVALGCFDGLHLGHRAVISHAVEIARVHNPLLGLGQHAPKRLMSQSQKEQVLQQLGVAVLYNIDFSAVMHLMPERFVREVLQGTLHAKQVVCGHNYHFGVGGTADAPMLQALCARCGIGCHIIPAVKGLGQEVSSTRIRALVEAGEMQQVSVLLGRPFAIDFPVVHGKRIGRLMGTPTLNQPFPQDFVLPRFGVYASLVHYRGKTTHGVTNVGVKPTVSDHEQPLAETWMPDYHGGDELYGESVTVELLAFLREERKFASIDALREEIHRNAEQAKELCSRLP